MTSSKRQREDANHERDGQVSTALDVTLFRAGADGPILQLTADMLAPHPGGLLHRMATSSMSVRDADHAFVLESPITIATLQMAVDEYMWQHAAASCDDENRRTLAHRAWLPQTYCSGLIASTHAGPALRAVVHPIELDTAWDYLGMPMWMIREDRPRPGSHPGHVCAALSLAHELCLAKQLDCLVRALATDLSGFATWEACAMGGDDDESHGPRFLLPLWIRGEPTLPRPDHTHSYFLTRELLVGVLSSRRKLERLSALFLPEAHQPRALCLRSRPVSRDDLADIRAGRLPVAVEEVCTGHNALKLCGGVGGHVATFALATPLHRLKTSSAVPRKLGLSELQVDLPGSMILQLSITQHNAIDDGTRLQIDAVVRRPYLAVREVSVPTIVLRWQAFALHSASRRLSADLTSDDADASLGRKVTRWQHLFPVESRKVGIESGGRDEAEANAIAARSPSGLRNVVREIRSPVHTSPALALGATECTHQVHFPEACGEVVLPCSGVNHPIAYSDDLYFRRLAVSSLPSQHLAPITSSQLDELPPAEVAGRFLTFVFSVYQPSQQDSCPLLRNVSSLDALPDWLDIDEALEEEDAQCALRELVMLEIDAC